MTYIEFFVNDSIENLCACLAHAPERVILIGDKRKHMEKHIERYQAIFAARGLDIEFLYRSVTKHDLTNIVDTLTDIVNTYPDCAFGLTGGEELYLVAMGIVYERCRASGIQMHRFNIRNNTIVDCDQDGCTIWEQEPPAISIREHAIAYGGYLADDPVCGDPAKRWHWEDDFADDINRMWAICRDEPGKWNKQIDVFTAIEQIAGNDPNRLLTEAALGYVKTHLEMTGHPYMEDWTILSQLYHDELAAVFIQDGMISITYKNEQVKRCLNTAGLILELKVYLEALTAQNADGEYIYNDVLNGILLNWDSHDTEENYVVKNEIDVMMMHGMVPVFVSCKNGNFTADELYKLNAVAGHFGGKYAKKVLVTTSLDPQSEFADYIRRRAGDMKIGIIDDIAKLDDKKLRDRICNLWEQ